MIATGNFKNFQLKIAQEIKMEKRILDNSSECISYKMSTEDMENYLKKYNK